MSCSEYHWSIKQGWMVESYVSSSVLPVFLPDCGHGDTKTRYGSRSLQLHFISHLVMDHLYWVNLGTPLWCFLMVGGTGICFRLESSALTSVPHLACCCVVGQRECLSGTWRPRHWKSHFRWEMFVCVCMHVGHGIEVWLCVKIPATAVTWGWTGYRKKSRHRKLTLEKKILPVLLLGLEPETFQSRVQHCTAELSPHPVYCFSFSCSHA